MNLLNNSRVRDVLEHIGIAIVIGLFTFGIGGVLYLMGKFAEWLQNQESPALKTLGWLISIGIAVTVVVIFFYVLEWKQTQD